jgi:protein-tyrosine-phosphatase
MAAALLGRRAGAGASVHSAGSRAGAEIDPNVQSAMVEIGVGLSEECGPAKSSSEVSSSHHDARYFIESVQSNITTQGGWT